MHLKQRCTLQVATVLFLTANLGLPFSPQKTAKHRVGPNYMNVNVGDSWTDAAALSSDNDETDETSSNSSSLAFSSGRKMNLMWCDRDRCKDVVRERVVGTHNQIVLNGPATGQVAYRWSEEDAPVTETSKSSTLSSILLLVRPGDDDLMDKAAEVVPQLTKAGIKVLLVPDLAARLKYNYGVEDDRIMLFDPPEYIANQKDRYVEDDEEEWVQDMSMEPFPDLVCTMGGDGLLIHASMLFQGPIPPIISIAGGSLGFLTPFELDETVEAVRIALGMQVSDDADSSSNNELEVFPPNMPTYPYDPLLRPSHLHDTSPRLSFGLGGIICMTIRMRLDCRVVNPEGIVRERFNVLNEVVIDRGSSPYLAALECFCDDVHLTTVQADGIIFAT
jgi:NAD kinase